MTARVGLSWTVGANGNSKPWSYVGIKRGYSDSDHGLEHVPGDLGWVTTWFCGIPLQSIYRTTGAFAPRPLAPRWGKLPCSTSRQDWQPGRLWLGPWNRLHGPHASEWHSDFCRRWIPAKLVDICRDPASVFRRQQLRRLLGRVRARWSRSAILTRQSTARPNIWRLGSHAIVTNPSPFRNALTSHYRVERLRCRMPKRQRP